jgi:hypothetical protein
MALCVFILAYRVLYRYFFHWCFCINFNLKNQALAALDLLSAANLVNYFGKCDNVICLHGVVFVNSTFVQILPSSGDSQLVSFANLPDSLPLSGG